MQPLFHRKMPLLALLSLLVQVAAPASRACADPPEGAGPPPQLFDERVEYHLRRMQSHFESLQGFSVEAELVTEVGTGKDVRSRRKDLSIKFSRPNRLLMSSGPLRFASDGSTLRFIVAGKSKFIDRRAPSDFRIIDHDQGFNIVAGHARGLIAALLFPETLYEAMTKGVQSTQYEAAAGGEWTSLKLHAQNIDWELWIPDGEPTPERLRVTPSRRRIVDGQHVITLPPSVVTVRFCNWVTDPQFGAEDFRIDTPEGAKQIDSLSDLIDTGRPNGPDPLQGRPAPPFVLRTLGGETVDLNRHINRDIVVLDFWSMWSGTSRKTLPIFVRARAKYRDKDVVFFALDVGEDAETVRQYLDATKQDLGVVVLDQDGKVASAYGITGLPQSFIVDNTGKVHVVFRGFSSDLESRFAAELDNILSGTVSTASANTESAADATAAIDGDGLKSDQ